MRNELIFRDKKNKAVTIDKKTSVRASLRYIPCSDNPRRRLGVTIAAT